MSHRKTALTGLRLNIERQPLDLSSPVVRDNDNVSVVVTTWNSKGTQIMAVGELSKWDLWSLASECMTGLAAIRKKQLADAEYTAEMMRTIASKAPVKP